MSKKPNLFIVGAAKAGTTSLYHILNSSSDVYHSPIKEPNYFSTDIIPGKFRPTYKKQSNLDREKYFTNLPLQDVQLAFVRNSDEYKLLFNNTQNQKYIAESSTSYLYSKEAANNIFSYNSNSKIIIVLRNPIERAFSHYLMALRFGFTNLSVKEAFEKDINQKEKGWGISELFIELGLYYNQVKRYLDVFPKENVGIFLFDVLKENPATFYSDIFKFLDIQLIAEEINEIHNKAKIPRMKNLNKLIVSSGLKNLGKTVLPNKIFQAIKQKSFKENDEIVFDSEMENKLLEIYKEDIRKTSTLIDNDLSLWLK